MRWCYKLFVCLRMRSLGARGWDGAGLEGHFESEVDGGEDAGKRAVGVLRRHARTLRVQRRVPAPRAAARLAPLARTSSDGGRECKCAQGSTG